jgi:copper transport protein
VNTPPKQLELTYSEAVEPRFAIVSVTDANGRQQSAGAPTRSPTSPDTLVVPLKRLSEGWYLVYWRVISVDGHPVRNAFTFAVGPNAGPAPQFVIPSISETAATPKLVTARWLTFFAVMVAIGLAALRLAFARPGRGLTTAFGFASALGLVAVPAYFMLATADFALRSVFEIGALVPLVHASAFGRGYLDLWIVFALFVGAAAIAIWVDRPDREQRSVAEIVSLSGATLAASSVLLVPGLSGHAGQTSPRGWALLFDWAHLAAGSIWLGGLVGLLVLWLTSRELLRTVVPRFSTVALCSVIVLVASGTGAALFHLPTVSSLWQTSYGQALLWKIGLLLAALALAAFNVVRARSRLEEPTMRAIVTRVGGEAVLLTAAVLAAAVLSSLPPPSKALASVGGASAHVGPGAVDRTVTKNGYTVAVQVDPNRAAVPNTFTVKLSKGGKPVSGAEVVQTFTMLDMEMGQQAYRLTETSPGVYTHAAPALVMVGHWGLGLNITPPGGQPFDVLFVDKANG